MVLAHLHLNMALMRAVLYRPLSNAEIHPLLRAGKLLLCQTIRDNKV